MLKAKVPLIPETSVGNYRMSFDLLYNGDLKLGLPNGNGKVISISTQQVLYEGEVTNGIYNGKGRRFCNNVLYEEGRFSNGLIVEGVRYNPNGSVYSGSFDEDLYEGDGRIVLPNGFFVSGHFSKGSLRGEQTIIVSLPSAKEPSSYTGTQSRCVVVTNDFILVNPTEYRGMSFLFYFNGDVFVGVVENGSPKNGYFYRYSDTSFVRMNMDDVKGVPTAHPKMTLEAGNQYKFFSMIM